MILDNKIFQVLDLTLEFSIFNLNFNTKLYFNCVKICK